MKSENKKIIFFISCLLFFVAFSVLAGQSANFQIRILPFCGCGNNIQESDEQCKETGEQCDGADLAGASCVSLGYAGGTLSCAASCTFNTSACTSDTGGGGGGGAPVTGVIVTGRAYPLSKVGVLKDGQLAITSIAGPDANFNISLTGLSSGSYIFAVFSEDNQGRRSSLFTFPILITQGATAKVSGIFIAPTIAVDKSEVKRGENLAIFGQSAPNGAITIAVNSDQEFFRKTTADKNGVYLYNFDTAPLDMGRHFTKSKSILNGEISSFGQTISFAVGAKTVLAKPAGFLKGDLTGDGRVNLVDFSIAAYWYKRPLPPASADLNGDGKVNLVDFSIMAFYWTG